MFCKSGTNLTTQLSSGGRADCICEECYRSFHYGQESYIKAYKHCVLEAIQPEASRNICRCPDIPHFDKNGHACKIFPVNEGDRHTDINGQGGLQCGLLKLGEHVAEAKYDGMDHTQNRQKQSHKLLDMQREASKNRAKNKAKRGKRNIKTVNQPSAHDAKNRTQIIGSTAMTDEKEAQEDIPFFLRRYTEKYPFGNVHMALRVGPLVIENGVAQ